MSAAAPTFAAKKFVVEVVSFSSQTDSGEHAQAYFGYEAKLVLPDGSHALASCGWVPGAITCGNIESFHPEKMAPDSKNCVTVPVVRNGQTFPNTFETTCTVKGLGSYYATRTNNDLKISTPSGDLTFHITGSW
ncbi:hypothetical protein [Tunturiibacter gelidoferens]|uniref:Uncharacterized protein n=1 Tax=Tunturiibacter gelidiferens TaxID=3069689 RepID=A0A9X0QFE3_9BACT|nr:hypothetical protein [Edaphobacter lichenicola]MBB5329412.1 hypothetical protein [Edaphobacter lichenicola]